MIYINGQFLSKPMSGVIRFAQEVVKQFDKEEYKDKFIILTDKGVKGNFKFLKTQEIGMFHGNLFEQISLRNFMRKHKDDELLNLCNSSPLGIHSISVVHDVTFLKKPRIYSLPFTLWYKYLIRKKVHQDKLVLTVSETSKKEIIEHYKIDPNKVKVISNGANILDCKEDDVFLHKYNLFDKKYFLYVGASYPHKNINSIIELANKNKDKTFVIVSKDIEYTSKDNLIVIDEKISNEALKSLYKHAYALMLLSKFEGFGIPPLEALLNGTKTIILSDIEVFHEIYGDKANYIINNEIDLNNLKMADEEYINELVNKYNWSRVSSNILDILKVK